MRDLTYVIIFAIVGALCFGSGLFVPFPAWLYGVINIGGWGCFGLALCFGHSYYKLSRRGHNVEENG